MHGRLLEIVQSMRYDGSVMREQLATDAPIIAGVLGFLSLLPLQKQQRPTQYIPRFLSQQYRQTKHEGDLF